MFFTRFYDICVCTRVAVLQARKHYSVSMDLPHGVERPKTRHMMRVVLLQWVEGHETEPLLCHS